MPRKLEDWKLEKAEVLLREGESLTSAAQIVHADRHALSQRLRARGVQTDRRIGRSSSRRRDDVPVTELVKRYEAGESEKSLSDAYGIARSGVRRRLLEAGVTPRGQSEAEKAKWSRMKGNERSQQVEAAHEARRGGTNHPEHPKRVAKGRQKRLSAVGELEVLFGAWLKKRGLYTVPQLAVMSYNIDLAASPVAVEVHIHNTNPLKLPSLRKRTKRLMQSGWHVIYVWVNRETKLLEEKAADEVVLFYQSVEPKASRGRYKVIRGDAETVAEGQAL